MTNPAEQWTSPPIDISVTFTQGGVEYTADYDCRCELQIVRGRCQETI